MLLMWRLKLQIRRSNQNHRNFIREVKEKPKMDLKIRKASKQMDLDFLKKTLDARDTFSKKRHTEKLEIQNLRTKQALEIIEARR